MRLIDADALDSIVFRLNTEGAHITRHEYKLIARVILEFPTIDASTQRFTILEEGENE